ncbi:tRNA epoxyqueuosine(34) reductase QueG [bacterium]|nr:tRNA epoxyqueuosine(34) reductase QueG [bacterium]
MTRSDPYRRTEWVKRKAAELGFLDCRVAQAGFLEEEAPLFEQWLRRGFQADMHWLERNFDLRMDPRQLVPGARTVVCLSHSYAPARTMNTGPGIPKIARYAYGRDYHKVLKKKLKALLMDLKQTFGDFTGRGFVDSAPVHERAWAQRSGLGWIGKNSLLLSRKGGSYFFLAVLVLDLEMTPDAPTTDHCGSCTRCIDACPTQAIVADGVVDSRRCISYHTIELASAIPEEFRDSLEGWAFGCDICQEVCPWNRFAVEQHDSEWLPVPFLFEWTGSDWAQMERETFEQVFGHTPLQRAGFEKFTQSSAIALGRTQSDPTSTSSA